MRDGGYGGGRRGGRGGPGRSGRGGRGGGRGLGPRTFANRGDAPSSSSAHSFSRPIDTWTGSEEQQQSNQEPKMGRPDIFLSPGAPMVMQHRDCDDRCPLLILHFQMPGIISNLPKTGITRSTRARWQTRRCSRRAR